MGLLAQRSPVIKKVTVEVAFPWHVFTIPDAAARFLFHPLLAVAVLRILDILAGMKKRPAVEAPINISSVRDILPGDDFHQPVILAGTHQAAVASAGTTLGRWRKLLNPLLLDQQQGIVYLCFCHIPFRSEQCASQGKDRSNCRTAWHGIPSAYACSAFAEASSKSCEHIFSCDFWFTTCSIKSRHRAGWSG